MKTELSMSYCKLLTGVAKFPSLAAWRVQALSCVKDPKQRVRTPLHLSSTYYHNADRQQRTNRKAKTLVPTPAQKSKSKPSRKMQANLELTAIQESVPVDWGDLVGSDEEDEVEDESEDSLHYLYGLCYPVRIGDLFHQSRYQIIHKLGRGGFSTVWLAHDRQDGKDVALKILSSSENAAKEYEIHEAIKQKVHDRSRLVLFQDHFTLSWVDRSKTECKHHVLVLPLHGPSLFTLLNTNNKTLSERMSVAKTDFTSCC